MARSNPNVRIIELPSRLRHFEYKARVCIKTGRILGVQAGCRRWSGFKQAFDHYNGKGKYANRAVHRSHVEAWDRQKIEAGIKTAVEQGATENMRGWLRKWADRLDAIKTLEQLRKKTQRIQRRIRA